MGVKNLLRYWISAFWFLLVATASGLILGDGAEKCKNLQLVLSTVQVSPPNLLHVGYASTVYIASQSGTSGSIPAYGCHEEEILSALPKKLSKNFFVLVREGGDCSRADKARLAKHAGASGLLFAELGETVLEESVDQEVERVDLPSAVLSTTDWEAILRCRMNSLSLVILGENFLYWSYGGALQWTLVRGASFWFFLQILICIAARLQRMTSDDPTVETALVRRMRLIKQLTLLTFRNGNDDEEGARICAVSNQNISNSSFDQVQMVASSLTHLVLTDMPR
uniref:PA domain-containing protein n=2 Tax=Rhodosorus marinus TaxID=101924 RepID=A0A7S3A1Z5_9RHOD|mmetsp:Transcript_37707/g.150344  ORF Transcript_37707/g.150344 Transcript_37707/m.150344 type:complete len:282 (+) Transcript_37707:211-1056(+)